MSDKPWVAPSERPAPVRLQDEFLAARYKIEMWWQDNFDAGKTGPEMNAAVMKAFGLKYGDMQASYKDMRPYVLDAQQRFVV
jgi:hypothetical protein